MAEADELAKLAPDVLVTQRGGEYVLSRLVVRKFYGYSSLPLELGEIVSQMMRTVRGIDRVDQPIGTGRLR
jgi:hypothetical protein